MHASSRKHACARPLRGLCGRPLPNRREYQSFKQFRRLWRLPAAGPAYFQKSNMNTTTTTATQPIFRWNGQYFGFVANGYLMDSRGTYRGWIAHDGTVWQSNGKFLGDLVGGEYVLLKQSTKRVSQPKRFTPTPVALPPKADDRPARS